MPAANRRPPPLSAEERAARVEALMQRLTTAVGELTEGEAWTAMLSVSARLHRYSFRNVMLLHAQAAERGMTLTTVAGFTTWKSLGRSVRKGERGLAVLAPITRRTGEDRADPADGAAGGERVIRGVRVAHVFDLSQTDGAPLPEPPRPQWLSGNDTVGLWDALVALVTAEGYQLQRRPEIGTHYGDRVVSVRPDIGGAHATAVLAHELGHIRAGHGDRDIPRAQRETEAESIAYVVMTASGLDSAVSAVPYVAGWSGGDQAVITAAAETVHRAASRILTDLAHLADDADSPPAVAAIEPPRPTQQRRGGGLVAAPHGDVPRRAAAPVQSR
jgi:N-terminal domain of anti-restriction factor ArdC